MCSSFPHKTTDFCPAPLPGTWNQYGQWSVSQKCRGHSPPPEADQTRPKRASAVSLPQTESERGALVDQIPLPSPKNPQKRANEKMSFKRAQCRHQNAAARTPLPSRKYSVQRAKISLYARNVVSIAQQQTLSQKRGAFSVICVGGLRHQVFLMTARLILKNTQAQLRNQFMCL